MTNGNVARNSEDNLIALLRSDEFAQERWSPTDLGSMLLHQLQTPLATDIADLARPADCTRSGAPCPCRTFGELLRCPHPDAGLLRQAKVFATSAPQAEQPVPKEITHFLYIACLVKARAHAIDGVSQLGAAALAKEVSRHLALAWLPEEARQLLRPEARI